jgi:hypothetical protein
MMKPLSMCNLIYSNKNSKHQEKKEYRLELHTQGLNAGSLIRQLCDPG